MSDLSPVLHRRLLRRSRWRVAVLGSLVVSLVLALLSAGAYAVAVARTYAHLHELLERAAQHIAIRGGTASTFVLVDERGHILVGEVTSDPADPGAAGFSFVTHPSLGLLATLRTPAGFQGPRVVATPAQESMRSLQLFLDVLIALTLVGGLVALPTGYALAGLALRPLDEAVRERSEFVALASHQLRTPLSVIRTSAELAQAGRGMSREEALDTILKQSERMEALAARLTALARAEVGTGGGKREADLSAVASGVLADLAPAADQARVALQLDAPGAVRAPIHAEEASSMLIPLIDNAIRFSTAGQTVTIRVRGERGRAIVEVADQGPGIDPGDVPHVGTPFFRGTRARGGYGLGLAIARTIAERYRGRLAIRSAPGQGTVVSVTLPA